MDIKFSIVVPLYNKEGYVLSTLNSIFQQTFHNYEIIVLEEKEIELSEGLYHNGKGSVIRFVVRKK